MKFKGNRPGKPKKIIFLTGTIVGILAAMGISNAQEIPPTPPLVNPTDVSQPDGVIEPWRNVRLVRTMTGHTAAVEAIAFSPDGKILISGGSYNDPLLRFWVVETGTEIENLRAQRTAISQMMFSPNGETLVSSGVDAAINFWNWETKKYTATFLEHSSNILSLAITPDSKILVSGALDGIKVWELSPQRPLYTLVGFGNPTYALAIHPSGEILASGDNSGKIKFWNLRTATQVSDFFPHSSEITGIVYTDDAQSLITASSDRTIKIWDLATGELRHILIGHTGKIRAIALNPDGRTLASASNDGVRLWNIDTGELLSHLEEHENWVKSVTFSRDGRTLATGGMDFTIKLWQNEPQ